MEHATSTIVLSVLRGNDPIVLSPLQRLLATYSHTITHVWVTLWCVTVLWVIGVVYRQWRARQAEI